MTVKSSEKTIRGTSAW